MHKQAYETPALDVIGAFETITQAARNGFALDSDFPAGTPVTQLTFS